MFDDRELIQLRTSEQTKLIHTDPSVSPSHLCTHGQTHSDTDLLSSHRYVDDDQCWMMFDDKVMSSLEPCLSHHFFFSSTSGQTAADKISPVDKEVRGTEGESVTLRCHYETTRNDVWLYWYRHHSDLQAPQFILYKGARGYTGSYIPDQRYRSQTSDSSTELTITKLTLADTALYYCALDTQ